MPTLLPSQGIFTARAGRTRREDLRRSACDRAGRTAARPIRAAGRPGATAPPWTWSGWTWPATTCSRRTRPGRKPTRPRSEPTRPRSEPTRRSRCPRTTGRCRSCSRLRPPAPAALARQNVLGTFGRPPVTYSTPRAGFRSHRESALLRHGRRRPAPAPFHVKRSARYYHGHITGDLVEDGLRYLIRWTGLSARDACRRPRCHTRDSPTGHRTPTRGTAPPARRGPPCHITGGFVGADDSARRHPSHQSGVITGPRLCSDSTGLVRQRVPGAPSSSARPGLHPGGETLDRTLDEDRGAPGDLARGPVHAHRAEQR